MRSFLNALKEGYRIEAGKLIKVFNKNRQGNSKYVYTAVWVEDSDGTNERCLLFTAKEIARAEHRAKRNPEDLTEKNFITDLLD